MAIIAVSPFCKTFDKPHQPRKDASCCTAIQNDKRCTNLRKADRKNENSGFQQHAASILHQEFTELVQHHGVRGNEQHLRSLGRDLLRLWCCQKHAEEKTLDAMVEELVHRLLENETQALRTKYMTEVMKHAAGLCDGLAPDSTNFLAIQIQDFVNGCNWKADETKSSRHTPLTSKTKRTVKAAPHNEKPLKAKPSEEIKARNLRKRDAGTTKDMWTPSTAQKLCVGEITDVEMVDAEALWVTDMPAPHRTVDSNLVDIELRNVEMVDADQPA